jgi:cytochrome c biogenesis factor
MIPRVSQTGSDFLGLGGGYSFLWLSILYVMGACLKKIRLRSHPPVLYLSVFFCSVVFSWLFKILVENYTRGLYGKALYGRVFTSYTAPTMVICAVSLLLLFQNMKVGNEGFRSLIRFLSPMAFSVYLVQVQPYVWEYLLKDSCRHFYSLGPALCILMVLLSAFLLYCTCTAVDLIRVLVFRLLHVRGVCDAVFGFLGQRLDRLFPSDEGE